MSDDRRRTVLVVEDDPEDRAAIRRIIRDSESTFGIEETETGSEGLRRARESEPACILLDNQLPDMDAFEFLDALADDEGLLPVPVLILTGVDDARAAASALGRGAQDYILKGTYTGLGLRRALENAVEKFNIARELHDKRAIVELRNRQLEMVRDQLAANLTELGDATRAKDRFMAVMSHEMRTPLNAVLGYADLLEMGIAGELNEAQRDYIGRIRVGSRHLLDLINDVLDLTRADTRGLELDLRPVDAVAVAEEVVALLESQAQAKRIELRIAPCEAESPLVEADLQRLRQILTNLIGNAIKFTDRGSITVRCEVEEGAVQLIVSDTGVGITPEEQPLIFSEFYQADGDLTRRQGGSGLGLAISQRLARLMNGDILVRSSAGQGSEFTVTLPHAPKGATPRPEDAVSQAARLDAYRTVAREEKPDDPTAPAVVVAYGESAEALGELADRVHQGVDLAWTTRVEEVPLLARERGATLVVIDIACAGGVGWNAAHALREDPELSAIPVLLLPCIPLPEPDDVGAGLDLGWVTLVPKPFTHDQLTQAVQSAARGKSPVRDEDGVEVLIVDDDPDSRRVASKFLMTGNVRVREAEDGESALAEMRRRLPDVVVLDLMMPVIDGFGVLAAMRADPLLSHVPVVVLSAKSLSEAERQFLARSAVRVLQKGEHRLSDVATLVLRAAAGAVSPSSQG
jgi:signal transduction histidine kinase